VDRAIRAFSERFTNGLSGPRRTRAQRDHFAAVLLFQLERFFQSVGVGLIDLETQIGFLDPLAGCIRPELRVADGNLLDRDDNFMF